MEGAGDLLSLANVYLLVVGFYYTFASMVRQLVKHVISLKLRMYARLEYPTC
jgi:hypothetical protein